MTGRCGDSNSAAAGSNNGRLTPDNNATARQGGFPMGTGPGIFCWGDIERAPHARRESSDE